MNNTDIKNADGPDSENESGNVDADLDQSASLSEGQTAAIRLSSLQDLKAMFLAMDWEINDQTLNKLINESEKLMSTSEDDLVLVAFFKMLSSIGKYIKKNKANADKDAVGLLSSVFGSMEKVIGEEKMSHRDREQLVIDQIAKFQVLKQKITGAQRSPAIKERMKITASDEALKSVQAEVAALRQEVTELRQQLEKNIAG